MSVSISDIPTSKNDNTTNKISNNDKSKANISSTSSFNNIQKPIPTSVTIVNESTPLLSQYDPQIYETVMSLTLTKTDPLQRKKESIGLLLLIISALSLTAMSAYVKQCHRSSIGLFTIVFSRSIIQLNLSLIACAFLKINPLGKHGIRLWLLQRAFIVSIGLTLFFYSLTMLSLFTATVLFFLGPIFVAILSAIVFEESFNSMDVLYTIISIVGILFVTKPGLIFTYNNNYYSFMTISSTNSFITQFGVCSALLGALTSAMSFITVRKIGKGVHFLVHSVYFGAVSSLISPIGFFIFQESPLSPSDINWTTLQNLIFLGLFAFVGQCSLNQGLKMAPTGLGIIIRGGDLFFAFILGIILFNEYPDGNTLFGSALILITTTTMDLHKLKNRAILLATNHAKKRSSRDRLRSTSGSTS